LLQIAPPTREGLAAYDAVRAEVERLTGHVNGRFGDFGWTPVRYVHRGLPRSLLAGLFRRCRVGLVTPLRDGMNLVAKEYVAAQEPDNPGVLVLSQFAGAAEQLEEAIIVNPHDPADLARAMERAMEMPLGERRARHRALWNRIIDQGVEWWRERFLAALSKAARSAS
jgi:trehalose 6-phosphate synthase